MSYRFKGGLHPKDYKNITSGKTIIDAGIPEIVVIPLSQHIGKPAEVSVQVGDRVLTGQKIGQSTGFISSNIHSSVTGIVKEIKNFISPSNIEVPSVIIETELHDEFAYMKDNTEDSWQDIDKEDLLNIIKENGIVGMGGAAFPTHVKYTIPEGKNIDLIIINAAECEPFLTADYRTIIEDTDKLIKGIKILMHLAGVKEAYIGIENNKKDCVSILQDHIEYENIDVVVLPTRYPQGAEKQLIKSITNREVPSGGLPLDVGVVVNNVGTAAAVYDAVIENKPLYERIVTVSGDGIYEPGNYRVRVGTPISYLLNISKGVKETLKKVIHGGPMMGISVQSFDAPVVKGTSGILFLTEEFLDNAGQQRSCIRCGRCVFRCPMGLVPSELNKNVENNLIDKDNLSNINDCIECGCCTYACPARIDILSNIRLGKSLLKER